MEPLLAAPPVYRQTAWRWHVLVLFALSNCNQCLAWFSFSSLSMPTLQEYFGTALDQDTIEARDELRVRIVQKVVIRAEGRHIRLLCIFH